MNNTKKQVDSFFIIFFQILTVSDEFALDSQIVMYKLEEGEFSNKVDMSVSVTMGRLKIVFLNWFISNMLVS